MIIQKPKKYNFFNELGKVKKQYVLFAVYTVFVFLCGAIVYRSGLMSRIHYRFDVFIDKTNSLLFDKSEPNISIDDIVLDKMYLNIKVKNYQKLKFNRSIALQNGVLKDKYRDLVSAKIVWKNESYDAKIRLKGDLADHWSDEKKWSFRIKISGKKTINGMRFFSIQNPKVRNYLNEWFLHKLFKHNDLIALRYAFFQLFVNGEDYGIYAIEENFDKLLVENNSRREAPVFKLNSNIYWDFNIGTENSFLYYPIEPYIDWDELEPEDIFHTQFKTSKNLVERFRRKELTTSEVFDEKRLALFFAMIDLTGHQHASDLDNMKFYYNPISSKIEPILYDNQVIRLLSKPSLRTNIPGRLIGQYKTLVLNKEKTTNPVKSWYNSVFCDSVFFKEYVQAIKFVSESKFLNEFIDSIKQNLVYNTDLLNIYFPAYNFDNEIDILHKNQEYLRRFLHPTKCLYPYFKEVDKQKGKITITCTNIFSFPVKITSLTMDKTFFYPTNNTIIQSAKKTPAPKLQNAYNNLEFNIPDDFVWSNKLKTSLKINYSIYGDTSNVYSEKVLPYTVYDQENIDIDIIRQRPNISEFDFLEIDKQNRIIVFNTGTINLKTNLIIPKNYSVFANSGTKLNLRNNAKIISYSPFIFRASEDSPIAIYASDSTGQGILVINSSKKSIFENVAFTNLSNLVHNNWSLTAAITFYESDVEFLNCIFQDNTSGDDYLNVVKANMYMNSCVFTNINADAFDGDFVTGKITNTKFYDIGNDAIDLSGSNMTLKNIYIDNSQDKAISVGEKTYLNAQEIVILNSEIAVTSKDFSQIDIQNVKIESTKIGFCAFQKKTEFGNGIINITNIDTFNIEHLFLLEKESIIKLNNKIIRTDLKENVKDILYGNKYGKKSFR
jgi:hypothetical protein